MSEAPAAPPPREMLTTLDIPEAVGTILADSMPNWNPVTVAYTGLDGKPQLSFRGSVGRLNNKQLSIWVRNPESGILKALPTNPTLNILFADWFDGDADKRTYLNFVGRGHVDSSDTARATIYDALPQIEKDHDKERKGVAIVIDVDQVTGMLPGKFLKMSA